MTQSRYKTWYWGHPLAEPIDSKEYDTERNEVSKIIQINQDNTTIQKVTGEIDDWLKEASESKYYLYKGLLSRLWDIGITGMDILTESSAIRLFQIKNPNRFINDRHYVHLLGNKIIRIVPYWGDTRGYEHYGIGMSVIKKLAGSDVGIGKAAIQNQMKAQQIKEEMSAPLKI